MRRSRIVVAAILVGVLTLSVHCRKQHPGEGTGETGGPGCRSLAPEACRATPACEAIPYWGESLVACNVDDRGFATNCPFEGCRSADADCPTLAELTKRCPKTCGYNDFGIDVVTGCRTCECRHE